MMRRRRPPTPARHVVVVVVVVVVFLDPCHFIPATGACCWEKKGGASVGAVFLGSSSVIVSWLFNKRDDGGSGVDEGMATMKNTSKSEQPGP